MSAKTNMRHTTKKSPQKLLLITTLVVLLVVAGALLWRRQNSQNDTVSQTSSNGINLSPATEQEKQDSNAIKEQTYEEEKKSETDNQSGDKKSVTPVVVDAGQYDNAIEVRSYISGVVEDGGSCTFSFTQGQGKVTKTVTGFADATTTKCPNTSIPRSDFPSSGSWSLVVEYSSSSASGKSSTISIEIK